MRVTAVSYVNHDRPPLRGEQPRMERRTVALVQPVDIGPVSLSMMTGKGIVVDLVC